MTSIIRSWGLRDMDHFSGYCLQETWRACASRKKINRGIKLVFQIHPQPHEFIEPWWGGKLHHQVPVAVGFTPAQSTGAKEPDLHNSKSLEERFELAQGLNRFLSGGLFTQRIHQIGSRESLYITSRYLLSQPWKPRQKKEKGVRQHLLTGCRFHPPRLRASA